MTSIHAHVTAIEHHASAIADLVTAAPTAALFSANADAIPALERAFNLKPTIDAAIAYAADQAHAGDRVGSSRTVDYLIKELGLSYPAAINRLRLGHQNHGQIPQPDPSPEPTPQPEPINEGLDEDEKQRLEEQRLRAEEQRRLTEEAERKAAEEKQRREEAARATAREKARRTRVSQEKLNIINQELDNLGDNTTTSRNDIFADAVDQASQRLPEDLRDWVRTRVNTANRTNRDPHAAWKKRELTITRPDTDGGARIYGYLTPDTLALMEAALAPGLRPGALTDDPGHADTRPLSQRRHDALNTIITNHSAEKQARTGVGTVVISMSAKDIDDMTDPQADHRYPTNTRAMLTPAEILRLGAAKYHFAVVHDPDTGDPLHLGRTKRLATIEQRLALLATHLVCTNPDCTGPFCDCEIHHIQPWYYGGATDIDNLAGLCLRHHPDNRDQRDGQGSRGHAAHDPVTGRRGYQPAPRPGNPHPAVEVNDTERQHHSGGAKIRRQPWPDNNTTTGDSPPAASGTPAPEPPQPPTAPVPPQPPRPADQPSFDDMPPKPPPQQHHAGPKSRPDTRFKSKPPSPPGDGPPEQPPLFPLNDTG